MPDDKQVTEVEDQQVNRLLTARDVEQNFLNAFNNFGIQLKDLTDDLKALEIVTAAGPTTADIESSGSDLTNLANGKASHVSGSLSILARTKFGLDGDLLVILQTKQSAKNCTKIIFF